MAYRGSRMIGTSRVFPAPDPNVPVPVPTKIFSSSSIVEKMMLNCSGCSTLQDIVNLDLSNRRISTLDPSVFSRMSSLVDLNVTNNRLTGFPLSLGLRHLKKLNCNNNLLRSVQTLEQFPNLEELHIESNELTVADQYIVVYMLPKLKILNGKEVDLRETILNMEETLQEQVHVLWAESCAPLLKDPMSKAEIQMLEQQFVELLKNQVQFGPDALQEFTHHMLTVLAEKCVMQMTAHLRKLTDTSAPISKVQIVVRNESSGRSMNNGTATAAQLSKAVEKRQLAQNNTQEPASKKNKSVPNAGQKTKVPKTTAKRKMIEAQKSGMQILEVVVKEEEPMDEGQETNQECGIAYEPMHLLRCHSVDNDPTDSKTNVWKCAFEPNPDVAGASKWTVATCGSNQVCVIDCNSGKVLKKYQHTKEKDEFYCIAWTKLMVIMEDKRKPTTVLAAAGIKGSIKLLHTTQLLCYAEIKCERRARPINCLLFHPNRPNWLFCGSEDIMVFDIGIPYGPDLKCRHKKLFVLEAPGRVLGLVICPKSNFLMAGCDNGCYGWGLDTPKGEKRAKEPNVEFLLPSKARLLGDEEEEMDDDGEKEGDMIDGLALLKDDLIASKVACDGSIHVWSLSQSRKQQGEGSREVTINPLYTLEWCDSDSVYLDIGTWPGCGVLVSGDDQGEVWVYDVSKKTSSKNKKTVKPSQLLPWPENNEQELVDEKVEPKEEPKEEATDDQQEQPSQAPSQEADTREGAAAISLEKEQPEEIKDSQVDAEQSEKAVAQVLEDVVAKVVGEESQEEAKDKSDETPTEQVNGEKVEEMVEKEEDTKAAEEKEGEEGKAEGQNAEGTSEEKVEEVITEKEKSEESKVEKVEEEKAEKADAVVEETPKKRGRGRPRKNPVDPKALPPPPKPEPSPSPAPVTSSAAQRAKSRREQKIQEANKAKAEEDNKLAKQKAKKTADKAGKAAEKAAVKAEKAAQIKEKKAQMKEKKAQMQAAAAKAKKEERAREKEERAEKARERAKEKAEIAELRQSLKKPKKGGDDVMDIANTEDRIIVNDVAISSDCKFIVSVTNKNLICIWQRV
ncbi:leucine-rich repeat and WD repeat-containing protein 1-like [Diadema antillarum]|uniref:leucine-rich repeat and WD repeat-containing protein 1-like n=1 Tax=Diadema antillarum TaxID=105358 RepID=UPI003A89A811